MKRTLIAEFYGSLVGKKIVMAVTGLLLVLFVSVHLLGNLLIYLGPRELNRYGEFLKSTGEMLWLARTVLFLALVLHVVAATQLTIANLRARPIPYVLHRNVTTNVASRTMIWSGVLVFLYAAYHLMMFTFLTTGPGYSPADIYRNTVLAFQVPAIAIVYIASMLVLGFHLFHGIWSMLQTLGVEWDRMRLGLAWTVSGAIVLGYVSIPIMVLAGVVHL